MPTTDEEDVTKFLNDNPKFAKEYFLQNASPKLVESWVLQRSRRLSVMGVCKVKKISRSCTELVLKPIVAPRSNSQLNKYLNVSSAASNASLKVITEPKCNLKKSLTELESLNEKDLLMELIRDIAYELDVDALSHKILVNVGILTHGDRSSLFLCKGHKDRKYLVSHLFDVTAESSVKDALKPDDQAIIIPFGVGIAGTAASTGETINIQNAYEDPRFNRAVDKATGYRTHSILCMPIKNQDAEVIGVAQIINKKHGDHTFTEKDEQVFQTYLTFCGIGLTNAQLFNASVQEYKRNQALLSLAKNIFEDTECLETVVRRIMTQAQELLECERCTVYIIDRNVEEEEDEEDNIIFSRVFDLVNGDTESVISSNYYKDLAEKSTYTHSVYAGFAMMTARTGEILNIDNFTTNADKIGSASDMLDVFDGSEFQAKCMLCCPILNNQQEVIGVAQLLNKKGAHTFDDNDEILFESFTIFCGLGIHNTQIYEKAKLMVARQKVNMEVLQYHASAGPVDTADFAKLAIPPAHQYDLEMFSFDDINMTDSETCLMSVRMMLDFDLLKKFHIPHKKMCQFILTVKKNYRCVTYHNWRHAFNVAQVMYTLLSAGQMLSWFSDLESLIMLVGCLCHDLDHRGTNNTFQLKTESPIATLYGTSTMERHHFDHSVMILKSEGCNIFDSLNNDDYKLAMKMLEDLILSTDLALYFQKREAFQHQVETHTADWTQFESREVLRGMMMTACDVSAITKPFDVQQRIAELVASEFFQQGDIERTEFSSEPTPMMDRQKHGELPKMQVGFIDFVCLPLYKVFYHINPLLKPLYDGVIDNRKNWQNLQDSYDPNLVVIKESPKDNINNDDKTNRKKSVKKNSEVKNVSFSEDSMSRTCVII